MSDKTLLFLETVLMFLVVKMVCYSRHYVFIALIFELLKSFDRNTISLNTDKIVICTDKIIEA